MEPSHTNSIIATLHHESCSLQAGVLKLPFFSALCSGTLPRESYVNQLRVFAALFNTLERLFAYLVTMENLGQGNANSTRMVEAASVLEPAVRAVLGVAESHFGHLMDDLGCLNSAIIPEITGVRRQVDTLIARMRYLANEDPVCLMGYVFTFQSLLQINSANGSAVRRCFHLEHADKGALFYAGYGDKALEYQAVYENRMNSFELDEQAVSRLMGGMHESFGFMTGIHAALYPLPAADGMKFSAASINPEASSHEVPANEGEVAAAVAAGRLCLEEFAYFNARYGERGRRFASGDTAWLVTLSRLSQSELVRKTAWFGNFLAVQGMPRLTLERQLFYLHQELIKAFPDQQEEYGMLLEAVAWLKSERLKQISADDFDSLIRAFTAMTDNELDGRMKGTGPLIVSAVCDERAGVKVEKPRSIETWLTSADSFDAEWIAAVQEIFAQARAVCGNKNISVTGV